MRNSSSDKLVGLMTDQHPGLLVGILGILKSGSAFVPIDPNYPIDRILFMVRDCEIEILVTEEKYRAKALEISRDSSSLKHIVCVDRIEEEAMYSGEEPLRGEEGAPGELLSEAVSLDQLAYVIFTSGSTGTPKGVPITHRNLSPMLFWSQDYFGFGEHTTVLQNLNYCFDFGVFELLTTLLFGGTLYFLDKDSLVSPSAYAEFIEAHGVNTFHSTPSFFRTIAQYSRKLESLEVLHLGGEALTDKIVTEIFEKVGDDCVVFNGYGPTEATVNCSIYQIGTRIDWQNQHDAVVPIGKASANHTLYILDEYGDPVPVYVPGELQVGGVGLSPGYLNRPDLTAEKFIPDAFSRKAGSRLYRTGDLVRYLPDGNIEFLGRVDDQLKVRGFRIELGEIEAVLGQHPAVREVVVFGRDDQAGHKRLVAYLVPNRQPAPAISELRLFLQQKLPDYMIPSAFVWLDALPLNPNGKVDRHALPDPDPGRPGMERHFVAPRTPVEESLASIWSQVLGVEAVGVEDNFFELGGDSMLMIHVIARANQAGLKLVPAQLYQNPTIQDLARAAGQPSEQAEAGPREQGKSEPVDATLYNVSGLVPLTPIQHFFFEQQLAEPHHWNWSFLREIPNTIPPAHLQYALKVLFMHHDALRMRFKKTARGWEQEKENGDQTLASEGGDIPFATIDLSMLEPGKQRTALESTAAGLQASLDLEQGPLLRVVYFDLGPGRSRRLLIIFHHLVVDVVSSRILLDDFQTAIQQISQGQAVQLPPQTTSYQEWAQRLYAYAQGPELRQELDYWLEGLNKHVLPLPLDDHKGFNSEASAALIIDEFSEAETQALLHEAPAGVGVQINEVLLTALALSFTRWTGDESLLVMLEGHGREYIQEDVNLTRTVGWFTTVFPVELRPGSASAFEALLSIREQLRRVPRRGIGYGLLRYLCADPEVSGSMRALPKPEVSFNYLGQIDHGRSEQSSLMPSLENRGPERSPSGVRAFPLYIVGSVRGGVLRMHWNYSANLHRESTIKRLAQDFKADIQTILDAIREAAGLRSQL